jgi:hypothetical protein
MREAIGVDGFFGVHGDAVIVGDLRRLY